MREVSGFLTFISTVPTGIICSAFLFKDKRDLLELYNALNGSDYRDPNALEIVTLEDVIFLKMKNDLSFIIGDRLNLYEHQSTKNPNMPLRGFLYFARQYEGLVAAGKRSLYGNAMVPLPTPKYVVFYNGTEELEDETTLYLSDAFSEGAGQRMSGVPLHAAEHQPGPQPGTAGEVQAAGRVLRVCLPHL